MTMKLQPPLTPFKMVERDNPFANTIQGLANEPIACLYLLERAEKFFKSQKIDMKFTVTPTIQEIVKRLLDGYPRIAIIGGSPDHPAHLLDQEHILMATFRIWENGGIPFAFSVPVICDGTAQNNIGQSYSLASRNHTASAVNINFEGHGYNGAYVISGCDKSPAGILSGLASADRARQSKTRGSSPVWSVFIPSHVLRGGTIDEKTTIQLNHLVDKFQKAGHDDLSADLVENMKYILQCSADEAYSGIFKRAVKLSLMTEDESRKLLNVLASETCHKNGGICAFNGTGNSSRTLISALGFVPQGLELLTDAPDYIQVAHGVDTLFNILNKNEYRVGNILEKNFKNAFLAHNTTGSSTNIMLHLPAIMQYAGFDISLKDYEKIKHENNIPELFDHSLTQGRDTFVFAKQYIKQQHDGLASIYKVLEKFDVHLNLDAPTVSGKTWREIIDKLPFITSPEIAENENLIREKPLKDVSGVEVLSGNFFQSAVVKLAGMSTHQIEHFNDRYFLVKYYENEHLCNADFSNPDLLDKLKTELKIDENIMSALSKHNKTEVDSSQDLTLEDAIKGGIISFAFIIGGQGPKAYGMPEMFSPSQNLRHHTLLEASSILMTDGRYSGVTKGACIGHTTPEVFDDGKMGLLRDGDVLHVDLTKLGINLMDRNELEKTGKLSLEDIKTDSARKTLQNNRLSQIKERRLDIASANLLTYITSAEFGVVPLEVHERATTKIDL